jgi:hypothetical protein
VQVLLAAPVHLIAVSIDPRLKVYFGLVNVQEGIGIVPTQLARLVAAEDVIGRGSYFPGFFREGTQPPKRFDYRHGNTS